MRGQFENVSDNINDGLQFMRAGWGDYSRIADFLTDQFLNHEPTTKSLNSNREKMYDFYRIFTEKCLEHSVSFTCLDSQENLVGCMMSLVKNLDLDEPSASNSNNFEWSDDALKIMDFLEVITADLKENLTDCKVALELLFLAVRPELKGRGVAGRLLARSLAEGRELGCGYAYAESMSYGSQRVFEKMGFQTPTIVHHKNYLDHQGRQIFNCTDNKTTCGKLVTLKL